MAMNPVPEIPFRAGEKTGCVFDSYVLCIFQRTQLFTDPADPAPAVTDRRQGQVIVGEEKERRER
jgi:hypothetical protein